MPLTVDLAAIAHNAAIVTRLCRGEGLLPVGVFKEAYADREIAAAFEQGGITDFVASTSAAEAALAISGFGINAVLAANSRNEPSRATTCAQATTHIRPDTVRGALRGHPSNFAWLEVLTSDGKQGMISETLIPLLSDLVSQDSTATGRVGLLFNWGCLGRAPQPGELCGVDILIQQAERLVGRPLAISFGGSALLPILAKLPRSAGPRQLRVGEAVLIGALPGASGLAYGLKRPIALDAPVVDLRREAERTLILIGRGHSCLDRDEIAELRNWRVVGVATESVLIEITDGPVPELGAMLMLQLGYRSAVRCLLNRTIARIMIGNAASDAEAA